MTKATLNPSKVTYMLKLGFAVGLDLIDVGSLGESQWIKLPHGGERSGKTVTELGFVRDPTVQGSVQGSRLGGHTTRSSGGRGKGRSRSGQESNGKSKLHGENTYDKVELMI